MMENEEDPAVALAVCARQSVEPHRGATPHHTRDSTSIRVSYPVRIIQEIFFLANPRILEYRKYRKYFS